MFLGTHENIIDEKGRVIMPSKFRPELEEGMVMVYWFEECVALFTLREFKKVAKKVAALPQGQRDRRSLERVVFSNAYEATPDRQGRVTIPPRLRQLAGLNREVVTVGLMNRVEIWDRERWEASMQGGIKGLEETAEKLAWSGF